MINRTFWQNKRVFITGHTGFKGSWLCIWLNMLGAKVTGYALKPPTKPSLFELCKIDRLVRSTIGDIRDLPKLKRALLAAKPEIVIHMAAQPLVRDSYDMPVYTFETNVMGTVNVLEAVRSCKSAKAVINVTTDKCYENKEKLTGYKEDEPLGGFDPYSTSKACSELVTQAYRRSFLHDSVAVATARAGNVIGGGDWSKDRLVPDFIKAILKGQKLHIRNPGSIRPWQHVLESLSGYLILAEKLYKYGQNYAEAWNFGPTERDAKSVEWIAKILCDKWGKGASYITDKGRHPHEAHYLKLDSAKAKKRLDWKPRWDLSKAIEKVVEWTKAYKTGSDIKRICLDQIKEYTDI